MKTQTRQRFRNLLSAVARGVLAGLIVGIFGAFLLFAVLGQQGCTASSELAAHEAQLRSIIDDPAVTEPTKAEARSRMAQITAARAEAERQAAEHGELAASATMLVPGGVAFAGIVGLAARLAARERALRAIVNGIEAAKEQDPRLATAWRAAEDNIRSLIGARAGNVVRKVKAKRKAVK